MADKAEEKKPTILQDHPLYYLVNDMHIPYEYKNNIILKPTALKMLAARYFDKYNIRIQVCDIFLKIDTLAEAIFQSISDFKKRHPGVRQAGFIFISGDDPDDVFGHALPMIWERDSEGVEHLFFLDTTQYLGETNPDKIRPGVQAFQMQLMLHFKLWSVFGVRQIDYSSCFTDALVVLKDGLRNSSFKALITPKIKLVPTAPGVTTFYLPELLLKTAQMGSLPMRSLADFDKLISPHLSLRVFREKYDTPVFVGGEKKQFGTFTLFKVMKYAMRVNQMALGEANSSHFHCC